MTGDTIGAFVGREDEVAAISDALAAARETTRLICVAGPAGIGKTSLVQRTTSNGASTDGTVWTRCWNGPGTPALWPWRHVLKTLGIDADGGPQEDGSTPDDRFAQFDRICAELCARSLDRPTIVIVDDIHWADRASLELLHFIARDSRRSALRVVATYRDGEVADHDDAPVFADIEREGTVVRLAGLDRDAITALARHLGVDAADTIESVADRSAGNPFFATELLRQLVSDPARGDAVPTSVRALVTSQLEFLDEATRRLLDVAAVQGTVFSLATLAAATSIEPLHAEQMLHAARRRRLVDQRDDHWSFAHALVGETLIDELSPPDLARHHLATADALDARFGADDTDHLEPLAAHLAAAGGLVAPDRLVDAARRAAEHARRQLAYEAESTLLERAIVALRGMTGPPLDELVDLLIERCAAEQALGHFEAARVVGLQAADVARLAGDPVALGRVALVFPPDAEGVELDQVHDPDQARLREEALAVVPDDHPTLRSQLQAAHAISLYWSTPPGNADAHRAVAARRDELTAEALETAEQLGDDRTLAIAIRARLYANWGPATFADRLPLAERLIEVADRLGDTRLGLEGRVWRISDHLTHGRLVDAELELNRFDADAVRVHDRYQQWSARRLRANLAFMRGDMARARELGQDAYRFGSAFLPNDAALHFYSASLGPMFLISGTMGDAVDFVRDTAAANPRVPAWRIGHAVSSAEAGDLDTARAELDVVAADDFAMIPRDLDFLTSLATAAATAQKVGHAEIGRAIERHVAPFAGKLIVHGIGYAHYGSFDMVLGECAEAAGDLDVADHRYGLAIEQLDAVGSPFGAYTRLLRGRLLITSDPTRARRLLLEAIDRYDALGADRMVDRARAALDDIDVANTVRLVEQDGAWLLIRNGREPATLATLKGLRALQELVVHPNESRHALVLASLIEGHARAMAPEQHLDVADDIAIAQYRARLLELDGELDEADRTGDVERSARLQREFDALSNEVRQAQGFGGRRATSTDAADRARVNVTKHLKRAIERVESADAELGRLLRDAVATGMHCSYQPPVGSPVIWSR